MGDIGATIRLVVDIILFLDDRRKQSKERREDPEYEQATTNIRQLTKLTQTTAPEADAPHPRESTSSLRDNYTEKEFLTFARSFFWWAERRLKLLEADEGLRKEVRAARASLSKNPVDKHGKRLRILTPQQVHNLILRLEDRLLDDVEDSAKMISRNVEKTAEKIHGRLDDAVLRSKSKDDGAEVQESSTTDASPRNGDEHTHQAEAHGSEETPAHDVDDSAAMDEDDEPPGASTMGNLGVVDGDSDDEDEVSSQADGTTPKQKLRKRHRFKRMVKKSSHAIKNKLSHNHKNRPPTHGISQPPTHGLSQPPPSKKRTSNPRVESDNPLFPNKDNSPSEPKNRRRQDSQRTSEVDAGSSVTASEDSNLERYRRYKSKGGSMASISTTDDSLSTMDVLRLHRERLEMLRSIVEEQQRLRSQSKTLVTELPFDVSSKLENVEDERLRHYVHDLVLLEHPDEDAEAQVDPEEDASATNSDANDWPILQRWRTYMDLFNLIRPAEPVQEAEGSAP